MSERPSTTLAFPFDPGTFRPQDDDVLSVDPLEWPGYEEGLESAQTRSGATESVQAGPAEVAGQPVELALFDFSFFGGSMGEAAGERLARAMERAAGRGVPFILRTSTGGARMQEGMRSLVQMPKVVAARLGLASSHSPFIAVLGHPTTGGVLASLAALADVVVAETGATIGFAGPRVAEGFTGRELTGISHTAESALTNGLVDDIVEPEELRGYLERAMSTFRPQESPRGSADVAEAADTQEEDAWAAVRGARAENRPPAFELLLGMAECLVELRGDRAGGDDPSVDAAIVRTSGRPIVVLALDRERSPRPSGYRKARRCLAIAERLGLPVVTLVDTRGADPGEDSESSGIAWEIAELFEALLRLPVPTLSIVTGEGGSGGALAFASTDRLLIYAGAVFSVIGPEMAAQILWRDPDRADEAARLLKPGAGDLKRLGIADGILPEPVSVETTAAAIAYHLARLEEANVTPAERVSQRLARWRRPHAH